LAGVEQRGQMRGDEVQDRARLTRARRRARHDGVGSGDGGVIEAALRLGHRDRMAPPR
jgi:hypothetical protein